MTTAATIIQTDEEFLREVSGRIRQRMTRTAQGVAEIGRELIAAKARIGNYQNYLGWIKSEFGMSEQSSANFINVTTKFGDQIPQGLEFQPNILYMLAAQNTPEEVRTEITERAAAGEKVTVADVRATKAVVVRRGRQNGRGGEVDPVKANHEADCRMVTEGIMKMLDLFECDGIDPAAMAAFIIEHLDRDIVDKLGLGKLRLKRLLRTINAVHIVFRALADDLYNARRGAS